MFLSILTMLVKNMLFFTGSDSNNVFKEALSKKDEEKYLKLFLEKNDKDARNILIEHNLRLVAHIVKKYNTNKNDTDDLISIGIIGLIKGIDSFSYSKGSKLTTYCARCIENEILMYFRNLKKTNKDISLDELIGFDKDGNEISLLDVLKTPNTDYIENINTKDNIKSLKEYIYLLNDRERIIIEKRYGLNKYDEMTQKEIAKEMNISRSYVSRIEKRALTKLLREFIKNKKKD